MEAVSHTWQLLQGMLKCSRYITNSTLLYPSSFSELSDLSHDKSVDIAYNIVLIPCQIFWSKELTIEVFRANNENKDPLQLAVEHGHVQ